MKITVFTSNQQRHVALIESLAKIADDIFAIQESNTVFPGEVADFFRRSDVMKAYFKHVIAAEVEVFGRPRFGPKNSRHLVLKSGDLNRMDMSDLAPALASDIYVVFGASFIKGPLCRFLVERKAVNIHMGISPYFRGSSCNFWALYDNRPDLVGATIHLLSQGLDSGPILYHAIPKSDEVSPFVLGMRAVRAAHMSIVRKISSGELFRLEPKPQDKSLEIRYTRNADFTDEVAQEYLNRLPSSQTVQMALEARDLNTLIRPAIS